MAASILVSYNIEVFSYRNCIVGSITNISQVTLRRVPPLRWDPSPPGPR